MKKHGRDDFRFGTDLGFPAWVKAGIARVKALGPQPIVYTHHALEQAVEDKYGDLRPLPSVVDLSSAECVEVGVVVDERGPRIRKFQVRFPHPSRPDLDLSIPIAFERNGLVACTVWANRKSDKHSTVNLSAFDSPETPFPRVRR